MNVRQQHGTMIVCLVGVGLLVPPAAWGTDVFRMDVEGQTMEFVPQPQEGYVVQVAAPPGEIAAASSILGRMPGRIERIGGRERPGLWVVRHADRTDGNGEPISALRWHKEVRYVAPLFLYGSQTVAVIPEIVVRLTAGSTRQDLQRGCAGMGLVIRRPMEFTDCEYVLDVLGTDAAAVFAAVEHLSRLSFVAWAFPNVASWRKPVEPSLGVDVSDSPAIRVQQATTPDDGKGAIPNDEYFPKQWHLHNTGQDGGTPGADINACKAWEITTGDPNIVIAVIDTGVDIDHPDLVNNLVAGYDFYEDDDRADPSRENWLDAHGTCCAGLIAADGNNSIGVTGVAYDAKIMPIRDGTGNNFVTMAEEATAFRWAAAHGADVMSWSSILANVPVLHSAVQDVTRLGGIGREGKGCTVVFAAGNHARSIRAVETAAYPEVIAVGAADHNDRRCWYSNYGPELDITASSGGGAVFPNLMESQYVEPYMRLSTDLLWTTDILGQPGYSAFNQDSALTDYTEKMSGTSGATPMAAGVAALIVSVEPNLTCEEVRHYLCRSAKDLGDPGRDDYYGWGRVDARAALDMVLAKRADLNHDWIVDENDLAILTAALATNDLSADVAPAARRDGVVNAKDRELLIQYLGTEIPEFGLVAHWKLDETTGDTAVCRETAPATLHGGPLWQPAGGRRAGALLLDGVDDYVQTPSVLDPSAGPFSVFAWVKGGAPGQVIVAQQKAANWLMLDPAGRLMSELKPGRGGPLTASTVIADGRWHRVGLVWSGTIRLLYVDDVEVARDAKSLGTPAASTLGLYLGAGSTPAPGSLWSGLLDDVRIYDRAVEP